MGSGVSELAELLELLHGARDRSRTVRATIREWHHGERSSRAFKRHVEESKATAYTEARTVGEDSPPEAWESLTRLWVEKPARIREEREDPHWERLLVIRDGERWWSYSPQMGARSNEADPGVRSGAGQLSEHHLDPAPLIAALDFEVLGRRIFAGRPALEVRATPRLSAEAMPAHALFLLGHGGDEFRLLVDRERGVLLRTEARLEGQPFRVRELLEVSFDEDFPWETFVFVPPAGESVRPPRVPSLRPVSIEEAARLAPFTVFIPKRVPAGWGMDVRYLHPEERPPVSASVAIWYRPPDATHVISLGERAADESRPSVHAPTREVERRGRRVFVWTPEEESAQEHPRIWLDLEGTRIELGTDLDLETLLEIADSLAPAPTEPLRLSE
jgi:outer membrane lipoprotein-sorting protein/uncharacterized Zn-finger protein